MQGGKGKYTGLMRLPGYELPVAWQNKFLNGPFLGIVRKIGAWFSPLRMGKGV